MMEYYLYPMALGTWHPDYPYDGMPCALFSIKQLKYLSV